MAKKMRRCINGLFTMVPQAPRSARAIAPTHYIHQQSRSVTNAIKPDHITSLLTVPRVPPKPANWHPTLVHSSGEVKFTVIRLAPNGGEVPPHFHKNVWDYFMPLEGNAVIETTTKDGVSQDFDMQSGSFLAVGPGDTHRVRNVSEKEEFVFLLAQSPRGKYDFVNIGDGEVVKKWHEEE
ncbi:uncharacterized protein AB675_10963 [Cyphellophora attinorum]|uniref:Cupin type-2 domain-containing protein n=1 Tax=Cyphellophora attinorum TaxID=1664694 RepID=A0A0N1HLR6_9EURO|nr:uncharacterized protein AB675_10963 [Phialophora attinorum]KPI35532.1 hypothetical protein AB675_10963 [Phialophora attinorum]